MYTDLGFISFFTLSTKFEVNFCLFLNRPPTQQPRLITIKCTCCAAALTAPE